MQTYTVTEKQNPQSYRVGQTIRAKDLSDAKRKASRMQFFLGTVMEIRDEGGVLSVKRHGKWRDADVVKFL
jgi:ribosomal protein L19